jgi:hypothetical protein
VYASHNQWCPQGTTSCNARPSWQTTQVASSFLWSESHVVLAFPMTAPSRTPQTTVFSFAKHFLTLQCLVFVQIAPCSKIRLLSVWPLLPPLWHSVYPPPLPLARLQVDLLLSMLPPLPRVGLVQPQPSLPPVVPVMIWMNHYPIFVSRHS